MERATLRRHGTLGTPAVFFTAISTILGAILFLRFGWAVGNVGLLGTLAIIVLGHLVTLPTAMAIAEISTNERVEGGGEYFIISRSFGILLGAAAGLALYLSRAISVAFYLIAFGEAFVPALEPLQAQYGIAIHDLRLITIPTLGLLTVLMVTKGADVGMRALYLVVATLLASLLCLFVGTPLAGFAPEAVPLQLHVAQPESFFYVFAVCFPAFTGMAAGVGLSGDLRDPKTAIPRGTLGATFAGLVIYSLVAIKLALSAPPEALASDPLIMTRIAVWGPMIPIGLAAAALSSALGSVLVAPRILQALADDEVFPNRAVNAWLSRGHGPNREPARASLVTAFLALAFVVAGDVDTVAQVISMFFMLTYGTLCLISFLKHFAADPAYRPTFQSRWYISLFGALMCFWLMFSMSAVYASLALAFMVATYVWISAANPTRKGIANLFRDAIFQVSRRSQILLQQSSREDVAENWRPAVVCVSSNSFERLAAFDLLRWISHRYGFGTYIHYIEGYLSRSTHEVAKETLARLVRMADVSDGNVFVDTLISPSYTTAISQLVQLPGIAGRDNNMILLEYSKVRPEGLDRIHENYQLIVATGFDVCVLASSERGFGYRREIHIWLTPSDYENAGLMILLAYVVFGHADWHGSVIKVFAIVPESDLEQEEQRLATLITSGRLPISASNVEVIASRPGVERRTVICERSVEADLTIVGFNGNLLRKQKSKLFAGYDGIGNVLFVNTTKELEIVAAEDGASAQLDEPGEGTVTPATESRSVSAPDTSED